MVPKEWLANLASTSASKAPFIAVLTVLITALAIPMMLSLEGDFQVEDFIETESDLLLGSIWSMRDSAMKANLVSS